MAVLVEALSVIVRRDAIDLRFNGGWRNFIELVPNGTLCYENELARVGFMSPEAVGGFCELLYENGLEVFGNGEFIDAAVVDQVNGLTLPTSWLEFGKLQCDDDGNRVSACWLFEGERKGAGLHFKSLEIDLALPIDWTYADSLSNKFEFVKNEDKNMRLKFLRRDLSSDIYFDNELGREVRLPHTKAGG